MSILLNILFALVFSHILELISHVCSAEARRINILVVTLFFFSLLVLLSIKVSQILKIVFHYGLLYGELCELLTVLINHVQSLVQHLDLLVQ